MPDVFESSDLWTRGFNIFDSEDCEINAVFYQVKFGEESYFPSSYLPLISQYINMKEF